MGKKKAGRIELGGGGGGGLTHNPFAALRGPGPEGAEGAEEAKGAKSSAGAASAPGTGPGDPPGDPPGSRAGEQGWLTGAPLVVRHERKGHGGKTVTVIDGSRVQAGTTERWAQLAKDLRKALGVGARADGSSVVVQGELVERVSRVLSERFDARITRGTKP